MFWDKTNLKAVAQPARNAEWGAELYYNYALFKALWVTPDSALFRSRPAGSRKFVEITGGIDIFADRPGRASAKDRVVSIEEVVGSDH